MRTLLIGYSSIAQRRALPALLSIPEIQGIDIASRRKLENSDLPKDWTGRIYDDYQRAIDDSDAELVYVSLINRIHETWAEAALRAGKHVIVDKPAFMSLASAERLVKLAAQHRVCIAEAVVFGDHPQVTALQQLSADSAGITRISTIFSMPPLPAENFRNSSDAGGGSLYDLGPYVATTSRIFFRKAPSSLVCQVLNRHPDSGTDTAFSILATYDGGRSLVGQFGFDTEYQNRITLFGPDLAISVDRFFTTAPDQEGQLVINQKNGRSIERVEPADSFLAFLNRVVGCIGNDDWSSLTDDLLKDAKMLERIRSAAQETHSQ